MRSAGLSASVALLSLHTALISAKTVCHAVSLPDWAVVSFSGLHDALNGSITDLCGQHIADPAPVTHNIGDVVFEIVEETERKSAEECITAFTSIIADCVSSQQVNGGLVYSANGSIFEAYHDGFDHYDEGDVVFGDLHESVKSKDMEKRRSRGRQRKPKDRHRRPKSKGRKKKSAHKKPTHKKPAHKKPTHKKPTHKTTGTTKSHSAKASKTSASAKTGPTKSCKQIYDIVAKDLKAEEHNNNKREDPFDTLHGLAGLEERATDKHGKACAIALNALRYPQVNEMPSNAPYYGMKEPKVCDNLAFAPDTSTTAKGLTQGDYQIEHVLEWQVVTKFFDWLAEKPLNKDFPNPDPNIKKRVNFCDYWKGTWTGEGSPKFQLNNNGEERTATDHLKWAYPGKNHFDDEFVYLQTTLNSGPKSQMWDDKKTTGIFSENSRGKKDTPKFRPGMPEAIMGVKSGRGPNKKVAPPKIDYARGAFVKLKHLLGARLYLKSPKIEEIFKKQKERIGEVLDALDKELENHPKDMEGTMQNAWERQGLKAYWDEYMNERFDMAKRRCDGDMDKYVDMLESHWRPKQGTTANDKDVIVFYGQIKRLQAAWNKEKAASWTAPW